MLIVHDHRIPREYLDAITRKFPGALFFPFKGPRSGASKVYYSIFSHPDIYFFQIDERTLVHAPSLSEDLFLRLRDEGIRLIEGEKDPSGEYPSTALYNAARIGGVILHNFKATDKGLSEVVKALGMERLDVSQGYCACSVVPAGKRGLVTADEGIACEAKKRGFDTLLVSRGHVNLPGERYGFLGGTCGVLPDEGILFLGDITRHPDGESIIAFLSGRGVNIVSLEGLPLLDAGRLIILENKK